MSHNERDLFASRDKGGTGSLNSQTRHNAPRVKSRRLSSPASMSANSIDNELSKLKEAGEAIQLIRVGVTRELELAKQMRIEAERYLRETETRARSEAQSLILKARLATKKEIEKLVRDSNKEIQKALADIRVIRVTAQEELKAQRKFTDAAQINALSLSISKSVNKKADKSESKQKEAISV